MLKAVFVAYLKCLSADRRFMPLRLPFTSTQKEQAECFVSLLMRPVVCQSQVEGSSSSRNRWKCAFFAPGNLVSNLDFSRIHFRQRAGDPFPAGK